ncbi:hypothetical protein TWF751_005049 [Orbilia oligospora]|nr:hypothetical protein TWF751_005049 [Orbilia oligospora]
MAYTRSGSGSGSTPGAKTRSRRKQQGVGRSAGNADENDTGAEDTNEEEGSGAGGSDAENTGAGEADAEGADAGKKPSSYDKRAIIFPEAVLNRQGEVDRDMEMKLIEELNEVLGMYKREDIMTLRPLRTFLSKLKKQKCRGAFLMRCFRICSERIEAKHFYTGSDDELWRSVTVDVSNTNKKNFDFDIDAQLRYAAYRKTLKEYCDALNNENTAFMENPVVLSTFKEYQIISIYKSSFGVVVEDSDKLLCERDISILATLQADGTWANTDWDQTLNLFLREAKRGDTLKQNRSEEQWKKRLVGQIQKRKQAQETKGKKWQKGDRNSIQAIKDNFNLLDQMEIEDEDYEMGFEDEGNDDGAQRGEASGPADANKESSDHSEETPQEVPQEKTQKKPQETPQEKAQEKPQEKPQDKSQKKPSFKSSREKSSPEPWPKFDPSNEFVLVDDGEDMIVKLGERVVPEYLLKGIPQARRYDTGQIILAIGPRKSAIHRIVRASECNIDSEVLDKLPGLGPKTRRAGLPEFQAKLHGIVGVAFVDSMFEGVEAINPEKRRKGFRMPLTYVCLKWKDEILTWEPRTDCKKLRMLKKTSKEWDQAIYESAKRFEHEHSRNAKDANLCDDRIKGNASYSGDRGREQEREQERQTDDDDDDDDEVWEILLDETKSVDRKSAPIKPSENRYKTMLTSSFWNRG